MGENKAFDPRRCRWDPIFSQRRDLTGLKSKDESYVNFKRTVDALQQEIEACICDADSWGAEALPACHKAAISSLFSGIEQDELDEPQRWPADKRAWLDERNVSEGNAEGNFDAENKSKSLMGALELFSALTTPKRPGYYAAQSLDRRLVYVRDLDPYFAYAVLMSTHKRDLHFLRKVISLHLLGRPTLTATIPTMGFRRFEFQFHLSYFDFVPASQHAEEMACRARSRRPFREWKDLTPLGIMPVDAQGEETSYVLRKRQMSCGIIGFDEWNWSAYGLFDTNEEEEDVFLYGLGGGVFLPVDPETNSTGGDPMVETSFDEGVTFLSDPISAGEIDASKPILKPRQYYLKVLEIRVQKASEMWERVAVAVESAICRQKMASDDEHPQWWHTAKPSEMKKYLTWSNEAIITLNLLLGSLTKTMKAWDRFNSSGGPIEYFAVLDSNSTASWDFNRYLASIGRTFEELREHQTELTQLKNSCADNVKALNSWLALERNQAVRYNGTTGDFNVMFLYPVALTAAMFSMDPSAIPFPLNEASFVSTIFLVIIAVFIVRKVMWHVQVRMAEPAVETIKGFGRDLFSRLAGRIGTAWEGTQEKVWAWLRRNEAGRQMGRTNTHGDDIEIGVF